MRQTKSEPDPLLYRDVDMNCPHNIPRTLKFLGCFYFSPGTVYLGPLPIWPLNDVADQQELRPRGPSSMLSLIPQLKDVFDKFEQDFQAANLPEGKYIKPLAYTYKWYN